MCYFEGYDAYTQIHPMDLDHTKLSFTEEQAAAFNQYVKSTRIRGARNISGFSLPAGTSDQHRAGNIVININYLDQTRYHKVPKPTFFKGVEDVLKKIFDGLTGELAGTYYEVQK